MLIDCDTCAVRDRDCADCVVTVLLGAAPPVTAGAVELDEAEQTALAVLAGSGLVPPLRLLPDREAGATEPEPEPQSTTERGRGGELRRGIARPA